MFFDSGVELGKQLMNSQVGDFGDEACEGREVQGGLIEGVGNMSWIDIWYKACFVRKGKGVDMSVEGRQNVFKEVRESLDCCNSIRNVCVEDMAMLGEMRV